MTASALTPAEVAELRERGFFVPRFRFSEDDTAALRSRALDVIRAHPDFRTRPVTNAHMPGPDDQFESLLPFCTRPDVLDMIESVEGADLVLWTTTVFHRRAAEGGSTPWHQDGEFWPISPLAGTSVWVALTDCTRENGCLRVIPGSHKRHARHVKSDKAGFFSKALAPDAFDENDAVDVVLEPGQMMLFDAELIHGSHPNLGGRDRTGFVARYFPSTSYFDLDGGEIGSSGKPPYCDRALFLVRGVDRSGRNDFRRNHWS